MNNTINEVVDNLAERFNPAVESLSAISQTIVQETSNARFAYTMHGIMSMILAHACAGIDIESPEYLEGIKTAIEASANNI